MINVSKIGSTEQIVRLPYFKHIDFKTELKSIFKNDPSNLNPEIKETYNKLKPFSKSDFSDPNV